MRGAAACAGLLGEGLTALGLRRAGPRKTVSPEGREARLGGSERGSPCWPGAASCCCICVSAGGRGQKWRQLARVCPERPLQEDCLSATPPRRARHLPFLCHRHSSDGCSRALCPLGVCQPCLQKQGGALRVLGQPSPPAFQTLGLKYRCLQDLTKISPSLFPSEWLWGNVLPVPPPLLLSLLSLSLSLK